MFLKIIIIDTNFIRKAHIFLLFFHQQVGHNKHFYFMLQAMLNFWLDKSNWSPSWSEEKSSLIVEHVRVTAL